MQASIIPAHPEVRNKLLVILVIGFVIALATGMLFAAIADDVLERQTTLVDQLFGAWLLATATPTRSLILFNITQLSSAPVVAVGVVVGVIILLRLGHRRDALLLFVVVAGGIALNLLLKQIFVRPRPGFPNTYYLESGFSFPSGHAMLGVAFYGALAYVIGKMLPTRRQRVALAALAVALALVIGFSRIYLGVHYLTDVLAGWMAGVCWLTTCIAADEFISAWRERKAA